MVDLKETVGADCYHPYEPQRTQEILANLNGAIDTWEIVVDLLGGDWTYVLEEEYEQVGDLPEG